MPRTCTVCTHPDRLAIDQALVNHRPYRNIAAQFRLSTSALVRHHDDHLPETFTKAKVAEERQQLGDLSFRSEYLVEFCDTEDSVFSSEHIAEVLDTSLTPLWGVA